MINVVMSRSRWNGALHCVKQKGKKKNSNPFDEREREREREYGNIQKCSKSTKVKILYSYFICYSYFTHTFYMFLKISIWSARPTMTSLAATSVTKATNWLPSCACDKS